MGNQSYAEQILNLLTDGKRRVVNEISEELDIQPGQVLVTLGRMCSIGKRTAEDRRSNFLLENRSMKWLLRKKQAKTPTPINHSETLKHQNRAKYLMDLAALSDRLIAVRKKLHPLQCGVSEFVYLQKLLSQVRPIESVLFEELHRVKGLRDEAAAIAESLGLDEVAKVLEDSK